jgi:hypothetical protein
MHFMKLHQGRRVIAARDSCIVSQEEEEYLIDLMHEEEMAERRRHDAEAAAAKREAAKREMMAANEGAGWRQASTHCSFVAGSTCASQGCPRLHRLGPWEDCPCCISCC